MPFLSEVLSYQELYKLANYDMATTRKALYFSLSICSGFLGLACHQQASDNEPPAASGQQLRVETTLPAGTHPMDSAKFHRLMKGKETEPYHIVEDTTSHP